MDVYFRHLALSLINLYYDATRLSNYVSRYTNLITISRARLFLKDNGHLVFRVRFLAMRRTSTTYAYTRHLYHISASEDKDEHANSYLRDLNRRSIANRRHNKFTRYLITEKLTTTSVIVVRTKRVVISRQVTIRRLSYNYGLLDYLNVTIRRVARNRRRRDTGALSTTRRTMTYYTTSIESLEGVTLTHLARYLFYANRVFVVLFFVLYTLRDNSSLRTNYFCSSTSKSIYSLQITSVSSV